MADKDAYELATTLVPVFVKQPSLCARCTDQADGVLGTEQGEHGLEVLAKVTWNTTQPVTPGVVTSHHTHPVSPRF